MKKNILFLLLLIIVGRSNLQGQTNDDYKPLLEFGKTWYVMVPYEYDGNFTTKIFTLDANSIVNINDTIYYTVEDDGYNYHALLREDTLERKVYIRHSVDYPREDIFYDFSLKEGDIFNSYFSVDSIRYLNYGSQIRKTFYLKENTYLSTIWVEGIGSLAGLDNPGSPPEVVWPCTYLSCFYENDNLAFLSHYGELWGCEFKKKPPEITGVSIFKDTVPLNSSKKISCDVSHNHSISLSATFISPSGNSVIFNDFEIFLEHDSNTNLRCEGFFNNFNNETGYWYLHKVKATDGAGNIDEVTYELTQGLYGKYFYVTDPISVSELEQDNLKVFYDFSNQILTIEQLQTEKSIFYLYDCLGKLVLQQNLTNTKELINVSNLHKGVYICKIYNNKNLYTKKIIIK